MKKAEKLARAERARALLLRDSDDKANSAVTAGTVPSKQYSSAVRGSGKRPRTPVATERPQGEGQPAPSMRDAEAAVGLAIPPGERGWHPAQKQPPPIRLIPKKVGPGELTRGDVVFYCGQRMYIEHAPKDWSFTSYIVISSARPPKDPYATFHNDRESFCVHADCIERVDPTIKFAANRPVTPASVATAQRAKAGIRDIGDEVALLLRDCGTLDQVYAAAAHYLQLKEEDLRAKYGHLNPGQQRMNLGNKMRFKQRKRG